MSCSLSFKAVLDREHYRAMKSNRRAFQRAMTEVRKAAQSCPFHHASQPSVDIEDESAALHEEDINATSARVSEYLDVCEGAGRAVGRSLVGDLAAFAVKWKIGRLACNELFTILNGHGVADLPKDCRAAKSSLRKVAIKSMGPDGSYFHFGIESEVSRHVALLPDSGHEVKLQFNVDGLPLYRSSPVDFWPILCRAFVGSSITPVFPVGLYCGKSKPQSVDVFLEDFLRDINATLANGLYINQKHRAVAIHSFICDAPARQYLKKVKSHSGYSSCERCEIRGERCEKETRGNDTGAIETGIKFIKTDSTLRTDEKFRAGYYSDHQKPNDVSPLLQLPIDLIRDFPVDYMHLVLLGVVKRLVRLWLGTTDFHVTKFSCNFRLLARETSGVIAERVKICSDSVPSEFQRRPRQMDENKFFKAKEFRTILCYTFPFIFRGLFTNNHKVYEHFLLLVVSCRVMLGQEPTPHLVAYVRSLLVRFVAEAQYLYGKTHMTYSVHNLLHVADDYERFGVLDKVSAFQFESYMQKLKGYVSRPGQELQQAVNRRHEESLLEVCENLSVEGVELKKEHENGPLGPFDASPVDTQYGDVHYKGKRYSKSCRDSCVCIGKRYGKIVNFLRIDSKLYTLVQFFKHVHSFFSYPCESSHVGIVRCSEWCESLEAVDLSKVVKCVAFKTDVENEFFVAEMLHETVNE